jgi:hypothetical protein
MKDGWQTKKLGEICEIERGGSPRPIQNFITTDPKGINWIKIGDATASGKYIYKTEEKAGWGQTIPHGLRRRFHPIELNELRSALYHENHRVHS